MSFGLTNVFVKTFVIKELTLPGSEYKYRFTRDSFSDLVKKIVPFVMLVLKTNLNFD